MVTINRKTDLIINLTGQNKYPSVIIARVIKALVRGGRTDLVKEFREEALAAKDLGSFCAVVNSYVITV